MDTRSTRRSPSRSAGAGRVSSAVSFRHTIAQAGRHFRTVCVRQSRDNHHRLASARREHDGSGADAIGRYFRSQVHPWTFVSGGDAGMASRHLQAHVRIARRPAVAGHTPRRPVPGAAHTLCVSPDGRRNPSDCTRNDAIVQTLATPPFAPSRSSAAGWRWRSVQAGDTRHRGTCGRRRHSDRGRETVDAITVQPLTLETECVRYACDGRQADIASKHGTVSGRRWRFT